MDTGLESRAQKDERAFAFMMRQEINESTTPAFLPLLSLSTHTFEQNILFLLPFLSLTMHQTEATSQSKNKFLLSSPVVQLRI